MPGPCIFKAQAQTDGSRGVNESKYSSRGLWGTEQMMNDDGLTLDTVTLDTVALDMLHSRSGENRPCRAMHDLSTTQCRC